MTQEITISKNTVQLCWDLREGLWSALKEALTPQQLELVNEYDALFMYSGVCDGSIDMGERTRNEAPQALLESIAHTLQILPEKHRPDRVYLYGDQVPLCFEALQLLDWRTRRDTAPAAGELEQIAASVVLEDEVRRQTLMQEIAAALEGLGWAAKFECLADMLEEALAARDDVSTEQRIEIEQRIAEVRREARELREQGR